MIVAHKPIASAFREVIGQIFGNVEDVEAVDIVSDEPQDKQIEQLEDSWSKLHSQETVVITDLCGATPSNISHRFSNEKAILVLDPLSLPLLMKVICYREKSLGVIAQKAGEIGLNTCAYEDNHCNCHE